MLITKRKLLQFIALSLTAAAGIIATPLHAQTSKWPEKAVRIIVPAPPGSAPDALVRMFAQKMSEDWKQAVTVENVVGASGNIGTDRVAKATPDGYTLLFNTLGPIAVNYALFKGKLPYDPVKDLAPISLVAKMPNFFTVSSSLPIKNMQELIALAKKEPGKIRYGTAGPGTTQHLSGELLNLRAGIKMTSVPYKSSAQMTTDGIGGQIELLIHNAPVLLPHMKAGTLRPLAITSSERSPSAPGVPTMAEAGIADFEITAWFGFMAPAGTPKPIVDKISKEVGRIIAMPEVRDRILAQASVPISNTPEEYAAFIQAETKKWAEVIKQANIKADE
ncbi:MAG: tripartite tricarboxylate transporter substrate binding protein [Sheuella sp.]|nr:tripartite tricarboxylate transporter substrate binding protein [Sheuella sp.]